MMDKDRPHSKRRRPHADSGKGILGQGALNDAVGSEAIEYASQRTPYRSRIDDADTDKEHIRVSSHRLHGRIPHCFAEFHGLLPSEKSAVGHGADRA
jgi:hypothetical protein